MPLDEDQSRRRNNDLVLFSSKKPTVNHYLHACPRTDPGRLTARLRAAACLVLAAFWACGGHAAGTACGEAPAPGAGGFVGAVARQMPAVVAVLAIGADPAADLMRDSFAGRAAGTDASPASRMTAESDRSVASGFIIRADGYVLTNEHAIAGSDDVSVKLGDGRRFKARVVGVDKRTDVALLKIEAAALPVAAVSSRTVLCPGEAVAALGSPLGFEQSVTAGVVSASPRFLNGGGIPLIQTDVALNPGSSGGPMFDRAGEVIGMNSMIYTNNGAYEGISLSLPIDLAMRVANQLRLHGHVLRGQVGARTQALTPELASAFGLAPNAAGAVVTRVDAGGLASAGGLRAGDVVVSVDGVPARSYADVQERVASAPPGSTLRFGLWRKRAPMQIEVAVAEGPYDVPDRGAASPATAAQPRLGLALLDEDGATAHGGVVVRAASGPARRAGIRGGDLLLSVEDAPVANGRQLDAALALAADHDPVALLVQRGATVNYIAVERR